MSTTFEQCVVQLSESIQYLDNSGSTTFGHCVQFNFTTVHYAHCSAAPQSTNATQNSVHLGQMQFRGIRQGAFQALSKQYSGIE